jgi:hypothetical protein
LGSNGCVRASLNDAHDQSGRAAKARSGI